MIDPRTGKTYVNSKSDPTEWVPAFEGQRPPFQPGHTLGAKPGNELHFKHGAESERHIAPIAAQIVKDLRAQCDWLQAPRFASLLQAYGRAAAKSTLFDAWLQSLTIEEAATRGGTPPIEVSRELATRVSNLGAKLGLVPVVDDDVRAEIESARRSVARKTERQQFQEDLKAAMRKQIYGEEGDR